jgi:hypothetical protein
MLEASRPTWRLHGRARTTRLRRPQIVPFVDRHICVHRIPLHVRDDAYAPHQVRNGCEETSISGKTKVKYFCDGIWTGQNQLETACEFSLFAQPIFTSQRDKRKAQRPAFCLDHRERPASDHPATFAMGLLTRSSGPFVLRALGFLPARRRARRVVPPGTDSTKQLHLNSQLRCFARCLFGDGRRDP